MTLTVYRLGKPQHRNSLFSGEGGLHAHGRWTQRGRAVVYVSGSISLAVLEHGVNFHRKRWLPPLVLGRATIPGDLPFEMIDRAGLPAGWSDPDPPPSLRDIGETWLARSQTVMLRVPSAAVIEEANWLLNPLHPDFARLTIGGIEPFPFHRHRLRAAPRRS